MKLAITRRNDTNGTLGLFNRDIDRFFNDFFSVEPARVYNEAWYPDSTYRKTRTPSA